ncbi:hypothetical protein BKA62DRAFT_218296 [Auriculariales sp. MPI-PUGE-AT-0066]|nr:hypothetical protein BKA62DRAFT_218296 [Auriculariales sp. MPI-PUGE-AT-0066]
MFLGQLVDSDRSQSGSETAHDLDRDGEFDASSRSHNSFSSLSQSFRLPRTARPSALCLAGYMHPMATDMMRRSRCSTRSPHNHPRPRAHITCSRTNDTRTTTRSTSSATMTTTTTWNGAHTCTRPMGTAHKRRCARCRSATSSSWTGCCSAPAPVATAVGQYRSAEASLYSSSAPCWRLLHSPSARVFSQSGRSTGSRQHDGEHCATRPTDPGRYLTVQILRDSLLSMDTLS